jgi:hypothetical protein
MGPAIRCARKRLHDHSDVNPATLNDYDQLLNHVAWRLKVRPLPLGNYFSNLLPAGLRLRHRVRWKNYKAFLCDHRSNGLLHLDGRFEPAEHFCEYIARAPHHA